MDICHRRMTLVGIYAKNMIDLASKTVISVLCLNTIDDLARHRGRLRRRLERAQHRQQLQGREGRQGRAACGPCCWSWLLGRSGQKALLQGFAWICRVWGSRDRFFFRSSIQATSWWIDMRWVLVFQLLFFSQAACSSRPARPVARKPNKLRYLQLRWSLITRCAAEADCRSWMLLAVGLLLVSWLHLLSGGFIGGPQVEFGHIWKLQKKVCLIRIGHV